MTIDASERVGRIRISYTCARARSKTPIRGLRPTNSDQPSPCVFCDLLSFSAHCDSTRPQDRPQDG